MRAVWSFWSVPYAASTGLRWKSERYHLFAWVLSLLEARRHYPRTALVTDTPGKVLLVERLGLPFEEVSTALDALADRPAHFWVLGKLYAYRQQQEPFFHLDSDVFLFQPLPEWLTSADFFAQNTETFDLDQDGYYRPDDIHRALELTGGWQPPAWTGALENRLNYAVNCGIVGGRRPEFIKGFAEEAIRLIEDPANQPAWQTLGDLRSENIIFEQYFLGAYLSYARQGSAVGAQARLEQAPFECRFLFSSMAEAFDDERSRQLGYTHLLGMAKSNPYLLERIEARVKRDYPIYYERCERLLKTWKGW
jgi:hypothetical protein